MLEHKRILLLSAYDAVSHQQWRNTLCSMFTQCHWTSLALPPRYFSWRVRGNSLSWAFNHRRELTDNHDLIIATSLTDLSSLRGFVPELAQIPTLVYFHENQFAYPHGDQQNRSVEPAMVNLYSALCANHIAFNSEWNRSSFLQGVTTLLNKLPDHVPADLVGFLNKKSSVLPVPLPDQLFAPFPEFNASGIGTKKPDYLEMIWNHRHEYDKGPDLLQAVVEELIARGVRFRLHLLGQRFRQRPAAFVRIDTVLQRYYQQNQIPSGINEYINDRPTYERVLRQADIVLSTALHDFQGLSMLEATALGCFAIAPKALAYPEYLPPDGLFPVDGLELPAQAAAAADLIIRQGQQRRNTLITAPGRALTSLSASNLTAIWQKTMLTLLES